MLKGWASTDSGLCTTVLEQSAACLKVYRDDPTRIEEDAAIELSYSEGGYQRSQLFELMQNATDALKGASGRIRVILTSRTLYVANEGSPFSDVGATTLLASHLSRKPEDRIGQFGLGFKSVLAVSHSPGIFSRSGSFVFDREWAERRITAQGLGSPHFPVLRLAQTVDPAEAAAHDPVLQELMEWAATIVRLPLYRGRENLAKGLKAFPAQFMLFAPHVTLLSLEDREAKEHRTVRLQSDGNHFHLVDNESRSSWLVVHRKHAPSAAASNDAGELMKRSTVDVAWAAPADHRNRSGLGEFWAYFPTGMRTTLGGIINAPWKLSADRLAMLDGAYNRELLVGILPDLVRDGLPDLMLADDPGSILDLFPARGKESRSLGDEIINEPIYEVLARTRSLPDRTGELRLPSQLTLQPRDVADAWRAAWKPQDPTRWAHHSIDSTQERRSKAERLMSRANGGTATLTDWLEAMVEKPTPSSSAHAIRLAAEILRSDSRRGDEVRSAKIVLLEDGRLSVPVRGRVFLRSDDSAPGHDFLHPELMAQPDLEEAFATLGIEVLDRAGELRSALQGGPRDQQWGAVWALIRQLDVETVLAMMREEIAAPLTDNVYARARSGKWRRLAMLFLPGEVIPTNTSRDPDYVIDGSFHARDMTVLERCGAVSSPRIIHDASEPWLTAFKEARAEEYRVRATGPKPAIDSLEVRGPDIPWPLESLPLLSLEARAAATAAVLRLGAPDNWAVLHKTNRQFKPREMPSPVVYRLFKYGVLPTTVGPAETQLCLHPDAVVPDAFPKAETSTRWADLLHLSKDLSEWNEESWTSFIRDTEQRRPACASTVYSAAAKAGIPRPSQLLALTAPQHSTKRNAESIAVTSAEEVVRSLLLAGVPTIRVASDEELRNLVQKWGMADGREMLKEQVVPVADSDPVLLLDRFPPLRAYDSQIPDIDVLELQTCSAIDILVSTPQGQQTRRSEAHRDGNRLLVVNGTDARIIQRVSRVLEVPLNSDNILEDMARQASNVRIHNVYSQDTIPDKLVAAVGAKGLRQHIPSTAIADLERARQTSLTPTELAELAHAVHGYDVLYELRQELSEAGLTCPTQWAGGREARQFVDRLGFPAEYAGFAKSSLSATLDVDGPVTLPPLHDYQEQVVGRIRELLTGPSDNRRGMVTLPTGAGKTRVAIEAVVHLVTSGRLHGRVIWIGQTEELCEQAVQGWSYVWRAIGSGPLQITRFWGGTNTAEEAALGVFQVVVCTIDKLTNAVDLPKYDWLPHPALIIIDEAHGAITPSYTQVLTWLGETRTVRGLETPLLGLTATAFRGTNEPETDRLVKRFGSNKLDAGVFGDEEPYEFLQRTGVLARVRQKTLEGMDIDLSEKERAHLNQMRQLSRGVESAVGQNSHRNRVIIESLTSQPEDWTTLLFASSVEHANALAAELSYYDVPAHPIHSGTDAALRRRYIEQFRAGEVRVLTNYNVLAQGFDAPRVQAVYVTRPTFSPNLYQQMIGRGLRGPRFGGSEEVLIVNVADNLIQYGDQLAFHHFDYLWTQEA